MDIIFFAIFLFSLGYVLSLFSKMHFCENYLFTICITAVKEGKDVHLGCGLELVKKPFWKPLWLVEYQVKKRLKKQFTIKGEYDEIFYDIKCHEAEPGEWVIE